MRKQGFLTWERVRRYSMPVNDTETCIAVMRGMLAVCGLCETEKSALQYAIGRLEERNEKTTNNTFC